MNKNLMKGKAIITALLFNCFLLNLNAQVPTAISYQSVVRGDDNKLLENKQVGIQISILEGAIDGSAVYVETHQPTTNAQGLFSIIIGKGTVVSGDISILNWGAGSYFVKSEIDVAGGTAYSISGVSQLLSVPYALYAQTAETVKGLDMDLVRNVSMEDVVSWNSKLSEEKDGDPLNELQTISIEGNVISLTDGGSVTLPANGATDIATVLQLGNDADGQRISNVGTPEENMDAVTKQYVDHETDYVTDQLTALVALMAADGKTGDELKEAGIDTDILTRLGIEFTSTTFEEMLLAGKTITEIINQGATLEEIIAEVGEPRLIELAEVEDLIENGFKVPYLDRNGKTEALIAKGYTGFVDDNDGNTYKFYKYGQQAWMVENLRAATLTDGTELTNAVPAKSNIDETVYSWYQSDESNKEPFGAFYNYKSVASGKLCPDGWHVPSRSEWNTLVSTLAADGYAYDDGATNVAKAMAAATSWNASTKAGTPGNQPELNNASGFNAFAAGLASGMFNYQGQYTLWWTSDSGYEKHFANNGSSIGEMQRTLEAGFPVRCVQD